MRLVVLGKEDLPVIAEGAGDVVLLEELLFDPERPRLQERAVAARRDGQVRLEDPLELEEGLVVEADDVDVLNGDAGVFQAEVDGTGREGRIALHAREALFLACRDDFAVPEESGGTVVVVRRDAEDVCGFAQEPWPIGSVDGASATGIGGTPEINAIAGRVATIL